MINETPLVTALICNYNYGRYIAQTIESVLNQTWTNLEIIVVDDGSTDDSRKVIDQFGDKVQAIYKENGGQASAFNAGLNAMRGDIVCFLDSDDLWHPEKVERVVEKFKAGQWGFICHGVEDVDENGTTLSPNLATHSKYPRPHEGWQLEYIEQNGCPWIFSPTSGMSLRSDIARKIMPLPEKEWRICADMPIAFGSIVHTPIGIIPEKLCRYRQHETNNFSSLRTHESKYEITNTINRAKSYLYLSEQLGKMGRSNTGSPKKHYYYYRYCCFFCQARPWRKLSKLWKMGISHAFKQDRPLPQRMFRATVSMIKDFIIVILIALGISRRFRIYRDEFERAKANLDQRTLQFLTSE